MEQFFLSLWAIILDMAPYLLLGFFIAGLLHAFVPSTIIAKHFSKPGLRSVLGTTLFGIPLPLCSCGVLPTTIGLRKNGVSRGACTSFLIATPQTGIDSILATSSVLGIPFAIIRPIAALITGILGGCLTDKLIVDEQPAHCDDNHSGACQSEATSQPKSFAERLTIALRYAFCELLKDVGKWLIIGLLIAAVITVAIPDNFFDVLKDYPFINMLIVLALAIPMYVCATGSIPIALSLMLKGLTPGAALVLLMAGPAINSASMLVIGKAFGKKQMLIYIASIIMGAIGFGLLIDYCLPAEWFTVTSSCGNCCSHEAGSSWFDIVCSILFLVLLINAFLRGHHHHHAADTSDDADTITLKVGNMNCSHCAESVRESILRISGVESVVVDHNKGTAIVKMNAGVALDREAVSNILDQAGFELLE